MIRPQHDADNCQYLIEIKPHLTLSHHVSYTLLHDYKTAPNQLLFRYPLHTHIQLLIS